MTKLATLQAAVSASEVETARVAAAMAELAQMRAEAAERARLAQIEADRLAAERKAEDDRRAALIAEQEAAALRQREAQAAELKKQADAQAERNRLEQAEIARQRQELLDMQADAKARADAEAARLVEAAAQAERDRVAADTKRQLDQQAADTAAARAAALVEQGRLADLADQPTSMAPADELADAKASPDGSDLSPAAQDLFEQEGATNFERAHTPPTLRLGQISDRLGFTVTASFMESLGFAPAATDKAAKLYHEGDFKSMCAAICRHISAVQVKHAI